MPDRPQDDDRVMTLVDRALDRPAAEREEYLRAACEDSALFREAWKYVQWQQQMNDFLLKPLCLTNWDEGPFQASEVVDRRFRIVREVGQGGMAVVYEAFDLKLDRTVAIKCAKAGFRQRLSPEVRNARQITHPNVCRIFEIHTIGGGTGEIDFITMEFLPGETLSERLSRDPLSRAETLAIARQISEGLAEAHRNGVVHGDLKSSNVILTPAADGQIRAVITDFGLARAITTRQGTVQSGLRGGTAGYMAPELQRGEAATAASDVYALGIILKELLTRSDAPGNSTRRMLTRVIGHCLEAEPEQRFAGAPQVAEALRPKSRFRIYAGLIAVVLAALSATLTYERTKPLEHVRLSIDKIELPADRARLPSGFEDAVAARIAQLKPGARTVLKLQHGARITDRLIVQLTPAAKSTAVHLTLIDARTGSPKRQWREEYSSNELRYIPDAVAGFVSSSFHLSPPPGGSTVNRAAIADYQSGLKLVRQERTAQDAIGRFERAVAADPDSALALAALAEAQCSYAQHAPDAQAWQMRAVQSAHAAARRNPDLAAVHRIFGLFEYNSSNYEKAQAEYDRAIEIEASNSDAYRRLGDVFRKRDQIDDAILAYRKAVEADRSDYRNASQLGTLYMTISKYSLAEPAFRDALRLAPEEPLMHFRLADALESEGKFEPAKDELKQSLDLRENVPATELLAQVFMYERDEKNAIPYLERAASLAPDDYWPWVHLGICYRRLGNAAEALKANQRALKLLDETVGKTRRDASTRAFLAYVCARLNDMGRARSEIRQAQSDAPDDDRGGVAVWAYEALGQRQETLQLLRKAPPEQLADLNRWPDLEPLQHDEEFRKLLAGAQVR